MRIISQNDFDSSALSSVPACAAAAPVTNLQIPRRGAVARISPVAAWTISGIFNMAGKSFSGLALCRHNLTGGATVRLRLYSDAAMTSLVYDSTALAIGSPLEWGVFPWGGDTGQGNGYFGWPTAYHTLWFNKTANVAAFKIDIVDNGNTDGYLEIGRVYLGDYWAPSGGIKYGFAMAWKELTTQTRMASMSLHSEGYTPYRTFSGGMKMDSAADRADFMAFSRVVGLRKDFFISFYPTEGGPLEQDHAAACKFVASPGAVHDLPSTWNTNLSLEEI